MKIKYFIILLTVTVIVSSCKTGTVNLFKPASPHEQYQRKLISAGFDQTAAGLAWINAAKGSLNNPLLIKLPFREKGYFAAEDVPAIAYRFSAVKGQKISINIRQKPVENFRIYVDLLSLDNQTKSLAFTDTTKVGIEYEINSTGDYLVRLQPELLTKGEYTVEINYGPSLDYPIKTTSRNNIQSFFGDGRDGNSRKHEGIDMFAPFRTPVIAAAPGTVTRVNENNLGGKVVWMRPSGKDYTLYYAHLDVQIAVEGQQVTTGDTLGLMGNTGNAKTTAPHLHFGVYGSGGAVDPYPFVNPAIKALPEVSASTANLNAIMRTNRSADVFLGMEASTDKIASLPVNSIVKVIAASKSWYRVDLPNGQAGFIAANRLNTISKPVKSVRITAMNQMVLDNPTPAAATKATIPSNTSVEVLGYSGNYSLIRRSSDITGWIQTE